MTGEADGGPRLGMNASDSYETLDEAVNEAIRRRARGRTVEVVETLTGYVVLRDA